MIDLPETTNEALLAIYDEYKRRYPAKFSNDLSDLKGQDTKGKTALGHLPTDDKTSFDKGDDKMADGDAKKKDPKGTADTQEPKDDKILDALGEMKTQFSKDSAVAEKLTAFEASLTAERAEFAKKAQELEAKDKEREAAMEEQKVAFAAHKEALDTMVATANAAKRTAEIDVIKSDLAEFVAPTQIEVFMKYASLPTSGDKIYKFTDEAEIATRKEAGLRADNSLLQFAVEFAAATPEGNRPSAQEETDTAQGNTESTETDTEAAKLYLQAKKVAYTRQGKEGEELAQLLKDDKAKLVSPN